MPANLALGSFVLSVLNLVLLTILFILVLPGVLNDDSVELPESGNLDSPPQKWLLDVSSPWVEGGERDEEGHEQPLVFLHSSNFELPDDDVVRETRTLTGEELVSRNLVLTEANVHLPSPGELGLRPRHVWSFWLFNQSPRPVELEHTEEWELLGTSNVVSAGQGAHFFLRVDDAGTTAWLVRAR